ncbi:MAG: hypothetical protein IJR68_10710, partial [Fretibacterium sp.]|nr:hypothetical protein [Fretibacterium sp.]
MKETLRRLFEREVEFGLVVLLQMMACVSLSFDPDTSGFKVLWAVLFLIFALMLVRVVFYGSLAWAKAERALLILGFVLAVGATIFSGASVTSFSVGALCMLIGAAAFWFMCIAIAQRAYFNLSNKLEGAMPQSPFKDKTEFCLLTVVQIAFCMKQMFEMESLPWKVFAGAILCLLLWIAVRVIFYNSLLWARVLLVLLLLGVSVPLLFLIGFSFGFFTEPANELKVSRAFVGSRIGSTVVD